MAEQELRMLYLIGGPPRCGKTIVSKRLAQRTGCSRVPTDYLGTAFSNYIPETERPLRYPVLPERGDARYAKYTTQEIITHYQVKAETCWPGIRDYAIYSLYDAHDTVIEGFHIEPRLLPELRQECPQFAFQAVFLTRSDSARLRDDLIKSVDPEDWVLKFTRQEPTYVRIAEMVVAYSAYFRIEAGKYGFPVFEMDDNFLERVKDVTQYLIDVRT
jgi:2-phosphoglycerate kinase